MARSRTRWPVKLALLLVSGALALELASYAYLSLSGAAPPDNLERYIRQEILEDYVRFAEATPDRIMVLHPQLGWYRAPSRQGMVGGKFYITDPDGARHVPNASGPRLVSTYGDSFTEGLEVENELTWPARLSYQMGVRVQNYAVSGYGPDQALLYLEEQLRAGRVTPVVVLAFIPENLNRLVSAFRPFYTYPTKDFVAFKPLFVETAPSVFEIRRFAPAEPTADALIQAARDASAVDHWFETLAARSARTAGFPYSWTLARSARAATTGARHVETPAHARRIMRHVINRFHADAREFGFIPVVVALPGAPTDFQHGIRDLDDLVADLPSDLVFIDVSRGASRGADHDYRGMFGDTHYSAAANEEVAGVVAARLRPYVDTSAPRVDEPRPLLLRIFDQTGTFGALRSGWYPEEASGTLRWRWSEGGQSVVEVFAPDSGPAVMTFRGRAVDRPGAPPQQLDIVVNATPVRQLEVAAQDNAYTVELPANVFRPGPNTIEFRYRWTAIPKDFMRGSSDARSLAVLWHELSLTWP